MSKSSASSDKKQKSAAAEGAETPTAEAPAKPTDEAAKPADKAATPADDTGKPGDEAAKPADDAGKPTDAAAKPAEEKVTYSVSPGFSAFLGAQKVGLAISSYSPASSIC